MARLIGTSQHDYLEGGDGDDLIRGRGGDDYLGGLGGHDRLFGDGGHDRLEGDGGDDTLLGGGGSDYLVDGAGDDHLDGGDGADVLVGEGGLDTILGGAGDDAFYLWGDQQDRPVGAGSVLDGGEGHDELRLTLEATAAAVNVNLRDLPSGETIHLGGFEASGFEVYWLKFGDAADRFLCGEFDSTIDGGAGDDTLLGGGRADSLWGGEGDDLVRGADGDDTLRGSGGVDSIEGGGGNDWMALDRGTAFGGGGDDFVRAGYGVHIFGGAGYDTIEISLGNSPGSIDWDLRSGETTTFHLPSPKLEDTVAHFIEAVSLGLKYGADRVKTHDLDANINAAMGNDWIKAGTGRLSVRGEGGADTLIGGSADDILDAGGINGDSPGDRLKGNGGNDQLNGDGGDELAGGVGDDQITGIGDSAVFGVGYSGPTLLGGEGDDLLRGFGGNIVMSGGDGADTLVTDGWTATLSGGAGADVFRFTWLEYDSAIVITDLAADDVVDISAIDALSEPWPGAPDDAFRIVEAFTGEVDEIVVHYDAAANVTTLMFDRDGDRWGEPLLRLTGDHRDFEGFVL